MQHGFDDRDHKPQQALYRSIILYLASSIA